MSGLEASEVLLSKLEAQKFRIDAEYYQKHSIIRQLTLQSMSKQTIQTINGILDCSAFYPSVANDYYFDGTGVPFIRVNEIQKGLVRITPSTAFLPEKTVDKYTTIASVYPGDIVIAKGGNTLAKVGIVSDEYCRYATSRDVIILRTNTLKINRYFLWAFLHSCVGQSLLWRSASQTGQPHLTLQAIYTTPVPDCSSNFQEQFEMLYKDSQEIAFKSTALYAAAESRLLTALGLGDFIPSTESVAIKSFSESFGASGRLDAEYYQRKYEDMFQRLSGFKCNKLGEIVSIMKSIEPGSEYYGDKGIPFVRVSDITKFGIQQPEIRIPDNITQPYLYPKRDTILLSKDGSVGIAYKVEENLKCVTSGALLHLTVKRDVLPDYLTLVLNSIVVQLQAERDAGGSIIQHWKPSEIEEVTIPILSSDIQQQISNDIQYSFALRRQSEQLLEVAKQAVEISIEQGENIAIKWLGSQERRGNSAIL